MRLHHSKVDTHTVQNFLLNIHKMPNVLKGFKEKNKINYAFRKLNLIKMCTDEKPCPLFIKVDNISKVLEHPGDRLSTVIKQHRCF